MKDYVSARKSRKCSREIVRLLLGSERVNKK